MVSRSLDGLKKPLRDFFLLLEYLTFVKLLVLGGVTSVLIELESYQHELLKIQVGDILLMAEIPRLHQ